MKKSKALLVMIIIFALCLSVCALTACDSHKHDFSKEVAEEEFIATEASCDQRATYYKSCSCGKAGTETFEYGDYKHNFGRDIVCDDCGYTRTEARKLYHGGIGEFMKLPDGNGIVRFVI